MYRLAQVGQSSSKTREDQCRWVITMGEFLRLALPLPPLGRFEDIINLKNGRDFLLERATYDFVMLHSIFHCPFNDYAFQIGEISKHHSIENWRNRLLLTEASFIVVCGGIPFCLDGWQLGKLDGYARMHLDPNLCIYRKKASGYRRTA